MPRVSIVVAAYQAGRFLPRLIRSIEAQTFADWELILVDGGSMDGTDAVLSGAQDRLGSRLRCFKRSDPCCNLSRNLGIEEASGEFVALFDADDEMLPNKLTRQVELFNMRPDLGLTYSDYAFISTDGAHHASTLRELAPIAFQVPMEAVAPGMYVCTGSLFDYLIQQYFIATIVGMVRRDVLGDAIRFPAGNLYGGEWLFYLEIAQVCRAGFIDEPLCLHHHVEGSLSRTSRLRNLRHQETLLTHMRRRFADHSRLTRDHLTKQLTGTRKDLAAAAFRSRRFIEAATWFWRAFRTQPEWRTGLNGIESLGRALATANRV